MGPQIEAILCECADVGCAEAFYRDVLGFPILSSSPHWVELKAGGARVALHSPYSGVKENRGGWVVAFVVPSTADLRSRLEAVGVVAEADHPIPGGVAMAFNDLDGNRLQAIEKR